MRKILALAALAAALSLLFSACAETPPAAAPQSVTEEKNVETTPETRPTEPETAGETDAGRKETEKARLVALSAEEAKKELFDPAYEIFQGFSGDQISWEANARQSEYVESEESHYAPIQSTDGSPVSYETVKTEVLRHFSRAFFLQRRPALVLNRNGEAWAPVHGRGDNVYFVKTECELAEAGDGLVYRVTSTFIQDSALMMIEDYDNIPEEALYDTTVEFPLVWENGNWVFDGFTWPDLLDQDG